MTRSTLVATLVVAGLALGGCARQLTPPHHTPAPAPAGPTARTVELPSSVGSGPPREVRVLVEEPALKLVTIVLRKGTVLPEHRSPVPVGTDLALLVHHLGRGEEAHP